MGVYLEPFRQQMRRQGQRVRWFKAMPCSCYDPGRNYYDRTCTKCSFGQVLWEQTLDAGVRVLISQLKKSYEHPQFGIIEAGQCSISVMPDELLLGNLDRLVLLDRRELQRERVLQPEDPEEAPVLAQDYPIELRMVCDDTTQFEVGADVTLDTADGSLTWLDNAPAPGKLYAVEYFCNPVFWFINAEETPPSHNPTFGGELPQRGFLVRKWPGET